METAFSFAGPLVLPFWVVMIFVPHWRVTRRVASSPLIAAAPALLYAVLVVPRLGEVLPAVTGGSLADIAGLLGTPAGATIAWAHFLAFDLLVGRWAYLDSRERGLSAWVMGPVLLLTFMLGPLGFLAYLAVRAGAGALVRARTARSPVP